jgi:hypothetical protein
MKEPRNDDGDNQDVRGIVIGRSIPS